MIISTDILLSVSEADINNSTYDRPEIRYIVDDNGYYNWECSGRFKVKKQKVLVDFNVKYKTLKTFNTKADMDAYAMKIEQITADTLKLYDGMYPTRVT